MIGSGFKKMAAQYGMTVAKGVAYGSLRGYAATFSEGSGYKLIVLCTKLSDPQGFQLVDSALKQTDLRKLYRVQDLRILEDGIPVQFLDNPGTLAKIQAFLDWFIPLLDAAGATKSEICPHCGNPLSPTDPWKLIDGAACRIHPACAEALARRSAETQDTELSTSQGSYAKGLLGALLGALAGAVVWAIVLYFGYIAGICGFIIGWCAKSGYELLKGKQGKGKPAIIIVAAVLGVLAGCLGGELLSLYVLAQKGVLFISEVPGYFISLFGYSEFTSNLLRNLLMGILFAFLGMISIFQELKAERNAGKTKIQDLQ